MDPHRPPFHRPNRLRTPIRRTDEALVLWPRRTAWLLVLALGLFVGSPAVVALGGHRPVGLRTLLGAAVGVALIAVGAWLVVTPRPALVVDGRGVSTPLLRRPVPIPWPRIAGFRPGAQFMNSTLEVVVRTDGEPPSGQVALTVPTLLLPARRTRLATDVEQYRPIEPPGLRA